MVESGRGPIPVDTGFIVHNDRTYPNFCRLMAELGVATQPSDMSFAVTERDGAFEYSSRGLSGFFAQKSNCFSPSHYKLLREILRFNRRAPRVLTLPDAEGMTLGEFLDAGRYSPVFVDRYLIPMAGAVWSMAPEVMPMFPVLTLVRFMQNHGMLGINTHPKWKVIRGGSHSYIAPLTAPFRERIVKNAIIQSVVRSERGVTLQLQDRPAQSFDEVVFACHGDQILPLLAQPTEVEREVLSCFTSSRNETCLHTDAALLPKRPAARASWNYLLGDSGKVTVTYHMNRLQSLQTAEALLRHIECQLKPRRILDGHCAGWSMSIRFTLGRRFARRNAGLRSAGRTIRISAGRTGFTASTRMGCGAACGWPKPWECRCS